MAESNILSGDFLVQAGCEDNAALKKTRENIRRDQSLGQVHGSHAVGLVLRLRGKLGQTQLSHSFLDAVGDLDVGGKALRQWTRSDLRQAGVQGMNELSSWSGEVGGLKVLIVLQDRQPVQNGGIV